MNRLARTIAALLLVAALGGGRAHAADRDNLYQVSMVVSGTAADRRAVALTQLLGAVLVKASGDPRLANDPSLAGFAASPGDLVDSFGYVDLMSGIALHDEQGSYDRPNRFTVNFDPGKIDALLATLSSKPWPTPRPRLVLFVGTRKGTTVFSPSSDGDRDPGMRAALASAAERSGVPAAFASQSALASAHASFTSLPTDDLWALDREAKADGGEVAVAGTLDFSDTAFGWVVAWRMQWQGATYTWRISGVSYDDAYRNALSGAAQVLSGHGEPE